MPFEPELSCKKVIEGNLHSLVLHLNKSVLMTKFLFQSNSTSACQKGCRPEGSRDDGALAGVATGGRAPRVQSADRLDGEQLPGEPERADLRPREARRRGRLCRSPRRHLGIQGRNLIGKNHFGNFWATFGVWTLFDAGRTAFKIIQTIKII